MCVKISMKFAIFYYNTCPDSTEVLHGNSINMNHQKVHKNVWSLMRETIYINIYMDGGAIPCIILYNHFPFNPLQHASFQHASFIHNNIFMRHGWCFVIYIVLQCISLLSQTIAIFHS